MQKIANNNYCYENEFDEELNIDLKKIFMIVWSRKDIIIKVFCSVLIFFILLTFILPKKYKVTADLYINKANNTNLMEINPYAIEELGTGGGLAALQGNTGNLTNELEIIQSPLVIDKVIRDNNLIIKKKWGIIPNKREGEYISTEAFLRSNISIENKKGTNVVTIEYKAKKPDAAYNIVSSIIINYIAVARDLHTDKAKNDTKILQQEYDNLKSGLNNKLKDVNGLPANAMSGTANIAVVGAYSTAARQALSSLQGQYASGTKSQIALEEETAKVTQIATKLQWAKMVEEMSDSSKVLILKEPKLLRDFENSSPKLLINIILGILFGATISLFAVIAKEILDKKLCYSKLNGKIIYKDNNTVLNIRRLFAENVDRKINCILFAKPNQDISKILSKYTNINVSEPNNIENMLNDIRQSDSVVIFSRIGETEAELYKYIKESVVNQNKPILSEILI